MYRLKSIRTFEYECLQPDPTANLRMQHAVFITEVRVKDVLASIISEGFDFDTILLGF